MTIPKGYKQTELGIIPEDWEVKPLCEVIDNFTGLTYAPENVAEYGTLVLRSSNIQNGFLSFVDTVYVKGLNIPQRVKVKDGDILVCVRNGSRHLIGKCARVDNVSNEDMAFGAFMTILRTKSGNSNKFIHYIWQSNIVQSQITENLGATINQITNSDINRYLIITPSQTQEQEAIAEALSDVDALIAALDKKIEKKRLIKQGTMQELLTGKKRLKGFTEEWVEKKLGKIAKIKTGSRNGEEAVVNGKYPFFVRSEKVYRINTYSFDGEAILVPGEGGIGSIFHYINGKFDYHQRVYKISDFNNDIHGKYIFYYLQRFFKEYALSLTVKATVDSLRLPTFENFTVHMPNDEKEQQAIAAILSDMDKEIAELEERCEKYQQLKSGMMQKLLTGQIRLVQPKTKTIPIDAHIVAGHIVYKLHESNGWGRVKYQKALHLINYHCQMDLGAEFIRNVAGPDDQQLLKYIDQKFCQFRHVEIKQEKINGKTHYTYKPTARIQEIEAAYKNYPQEVRDSIDGLLQILSNLDSGRAEILSTLYAVWNNRIIKKEEITDDLLVKDFYAWSEHKADFAEKRVRKALFFMKNNNLVPTGWGRYIDCKMSYQCMLG